MRLGMTHLLPVSHLNSPGLHLCGAEGATFRVKKSVTIVFNINKLISYVVDESHNQFHRIHLDSRIYGHICCCLGCMNHHDIGIRLHDKLYLRQVFN